MIVEGLTRSEIVERLNVLKVFIDKHNLCVYEKKKDNVISKIFDIWDNNNITTIVIYRNNIIKIEGVNSLLMENIEAILSNKKFAGGEMDYFHQMNKGK